MKGKGYDKDVNITNFEKKSFKIKEENHSKII